MKDRPRIGLALGAGGAKGFAHVAMLEVFDELNLRPAALAGSSAGAFFAVLYAAGWDAARIRALLFDVVPAGGKGNHNGFIDTRLLRLMETIEPALGRGGLISGASILRTLLDRVEVERLEDLAIPVKVVACDYWTREPVVYDRGPVQEILHASMAAPGAFAPVRYGGRVLVDGGLANPLPYDLIADDVDLTVAIDVIGRRQPSGNDTPGLLDSLFHSIQILRANLVAQKFALRPPDIYIRPDLVNIRMLDVVKIERILEQAQDAKHDLKQQLNVCIAECRSGPPPRG